MRKNTPKQVPVVDPEYLIEGHRKVAADHEKYGSTDATVSLVSLFNKRLKADVILNILHRLFALTNFMRSGAADQWLLKETGSDYMLVNEALLRAAARAPLSEAEYMGELAFDAKTFMSIVLEEAESEGKA